TYHTGQQAGAVDFVWPYLKHEDRFIQYAARIGLEHQPIQEWSDKALNEEDPSTLIQAIIALARHSGENRGEPMLHSLMSIDYGQLSEKDEQDLLRAIELILYRQDIADTAIKNQLI